MRTESTRARSNCLRRHTGTLRVSPFYSSLDAVFSPKYNLHFRCAHALHFHTVLDIGRLFVRMVVGTLLLWVMHCMGNTRVSRFLHHRTVRRATFILLANRSFLFPLHAS